MDRGVTITQSLTPRVRALRKVLRPAVLALAAIGRGDAAPAWPPFAPPRDTLPHEVAVEVERVWAEPTFSRRVEGRPVAVPIAVYLAFVDAPEVTAAAARHRGLARYRVEALGDDRFQADDGDGARGVWRVLARDGGRRVIFSEGEHESFLLGTIRGGALSVLDFEDRGVETGQRVAAWVLIDNKIAAVLARALLAVFGFLADRKLRESLHVTADVAEWATAHPAEFCQWLGTEALWSPRRDRLVAALAGCPPAPGPEPRGRS